MPKETFVGIDIAKDQLDVHVLPQRLCILLVNMMPTASPLFFLASQRKKWHRDHHGGHGRL